ncbi:MAG: RNase adaptor protein RapZ, partial [Acidobacteriota bacterium]
ENPKQLDVSIVSFGFKRGLPLHADLVFDMRFLPNPNYIPHLKSKTGLDQEIVDYMMGFRETIEIIHKVQDMLEYLLPRFAREGKSYCTVAIGCTGGKHRSVMVARQLAAALEDEGFEINLVHRDLHLE